MIHSDIRTLASDLRSAKINRKHLYCFALWAAYTGYIGCKDWQAFLIALCLTPPFALISFWAYRSQNLLLKIFAAFTLLAHAVGAPYFWLNRAHYVYGGFGAVKDFHFDLGEFFGIYGWVFALFLLTVASALAFDRLGPWPANSRPDPRLVRRIGDYLLIPFVLLFAAPLNIYMAHHGIGITGLISKPLPYRLLGLAYYSRQIFIPLILTWLYSRSSRGRLASAVVLAYGTLAGISSASRTALLVSVFPVAFDALESRSAFKLLSRGVWIAACFCIVGASRDYVYIARDISYTNMARSTYASMSWGTYTPIALIGGVANRLYGAQDMVLSYQYHPAQPIYSFVRYIASGGRADSVVPDLTRDLYGMVLPKDSGFGVGIGVLAYLLMLARASLPLLILGPASIGLLLSLGNRCLIYFAGAVGEDRESPLSYLIALFLSFDLYSSTLNLAYIYLEVMTAIILARIALGRACAKREHFPVNEMRGS